MDWLWAWFAFSLAAGAFYNSYEVKKENKKLRNRIEKLEEEVYKKFQLTVLYLKIVEQLRRFFSCLTKGGG